MPREYLHNHSEFAELIRIVAAEQGIDPALVEKHYWIMHSLYPLARRCELPAFRLGAVRKSVVLEFIAGQGRALHALDEVQPRRRRKRNSHRTNGSFADPATSYSWFQRLSSFHKRAIDTGK
jgi:hypothetical protein